MKKWWIIVIAFALTISISSSLPAIIVKVQEKGVYTPDRVVYTFVAYETNGISATSYVFPVAINTNFPGYSFLADHSVYAAKDPDCQIPIKYFVMYKGKTNLLMWIYVPTMSSSSSTTFYICGSTTNPDPDSGNPEVNHMFMLFDNFDGGGYISWTQEGPGILGNTVQETTTESNGTFTIKAALGEGTEAGLAAGGIDIVNTPYFIIFMKASFPTSPGVDVVGGVYLNMSNYWVTLYAGNAYINWTNTSYNGYYMFFSSSDLLGPTSTYPIYVTTVASGWQIIAQWNLFGNYPAVYPVVYTENLSLVSYTSATLYYTAPSPTVGIMQLRWYDSLGGTTTNTMYVDWFMVVQYWGFPSISFLGATMHEVLET